jgi:hypothetical protein
MFLKMKRYPFYLSITSRALKIVIRMSNDRHIGADFSIYFWKAGLSAICPSSSCLQSRTMRWISVNTYPMDRNHPYSLTERRSNDTAKPVIVGLADRFP